jgi:MoaA/NifB/PqqE/SkfB family radical SAM enzyme
MDFSKRPFTVIWETTRACDLACLHCRAEANPQRSAGELTFDEAHNLIQNIKAFGPPYPILILTGGDSGQASDICEIIRDVRTVMHVSP